MERRVCGGRTDEEGLLVATREAIAVDETEKRDGNASARYRSPLATRWAASGGRTACDGSPPQRKRRPAPPPPSRRAEPKERRPGRLVSPPLGERKGW